MKIRFIVLAVMLVSLSAATMCAAPPDYLSKFSISGTWQPVPAADNPSEAWKISPDRLQLTIPPKTAGEFSIVRNEPLPDGDWTVDVWTALHMPGSSQSTEIALSLGKKGEADGLDVSIYVSSNRGEIRIIHSDAKHSTTSLASEFYFPCGAGPIHWTRVSYSRQTGRLRVRVNGQVVSKPDASVQLPVSPLGIRFRVNIQEAEAVCEVRSVSVTPSAEPDAVPPGIALSGWQQPLTQDKLKAVSDLTQRLAALCEDSRLSATGHAYALAAAALSEKALTGRISPEAWKKIADFVQSNAATDHVAVLCLLPIAGACGDETQRREVQTWSAAYAGLKNEVWRRSADEHRALVRLSLLDPLLTAHVFMAIDKHPDMPFVRSFSDQLAQIDPGSGLAFKVFYICSEGYKSPMLAWWLPDLMAGSPNYGGLALEYMRESVSRKSYERVEPDRSLSFAAYRLAPTAPQSAMELWRLIADADVKAETMQYMSAALSQAKSGAYDTLVESSLKEAISAWSPTGSNKSPVPQYIRLAEWYVSRGMTAEAAATVRSCARKLGELVDHSFNTIRPVAKMMQKLKLPEADEWTKKAIDAAIAADEGATEYVPGLYVSSVSLVVMDLLGLERIEDALDLVSSMNPDTMQQNREIALSAIIQHVARTDMTRALELLKDLPQNLRRDFVITRLIPLLGEKNLDEMLSLFETVTPEGKPAVALKIAEIVPISRSEQIRSLCEQALADGLKRSKGWFGRPGVGSSEKWLAKVDLPTLFSFEPLFEEEYDRFAYQVLTNIAIACGLEDDPIWQRYSGADSPGGGAIPWGVDRLRYAVLSESQ